VTRTATIVGRAAACKLYVAVQLTPKANLR
jgi:hypothetical protein